MIQGTVKSVICLGLSLYCLVLLTHKDKDANATDPKRFLADDRFQARLALLTDWLDLLKKWSYATQDQTHII